MESGKETDMAGEKAEELFGGREGTDEGCRGKREGSRGKNECEQL